MLHYNYHTITCPAETPNHKEDPRRDFESTRRYHVQYGRWCVLSPCCLGVSSWVRGLFWGFRGSVGYVYAITRYNNYITSYTNI